MNENKIAFITCVLEERQYKECVLYINNLEKPSNFEVEIIGVRDTKSVAQAYNKGLTMTEAKYKVYLHCNTFIINKEYIKDILDIFINHSHIGLIGVVGAKRLPADGIWWQDTGAVGSIYATQKGFIEEQRYNEIIEKYEIVEAVDGLIMATQTDIRWREEIFDDKYFYDISQSMEFIKNDLQAVVPRQAKPWCIYEGQEDKGTYENYRKRFLSEYGEIQSKDLQLAEDLFNFNKKEAMQALMDNRKPLLTITQNMKKCIVSCEYETAARHAYDFAYSALWHHSGFYVSPEIENMLLVCAENLPRKENNLTRSTSGKRRVLHVLSEGYATGGHTRLAKNWIKSDADSIHSLVTTWQMRTTPQWLLDEVEKSGGWKYSLETVSGKFIKRAAALRKLAYEWADVVVLHMHMYDPIPIMAFGVNGGPPIAYMNHGDHGFWLGASIADLVIDLRKSGQELTLKRRGARASYILPIPLQNKKDFNKIQVRQKFGIQDNEVVLLTIASHLKFRSINNNCYIDILKKIIDNVENSRAYIIGPKDDGKWHELNVETGDRVKALGELAEIEEYYQIADIYLDCFMLTSLTSLLDAAKYGLPIVKFTNTHCPILTDYDEELNVCSFNSISEVIQEIKELRNNKNKYEDITKSIIKNHILDTKEKINYIYDILENHKVNRNLKISNNIDDQDLFWSLLIKKGYV